MNWEQTPRLELPQSLQARLLDYRRRVWALKLVESALAALLGLLLAFAGVFLLDRFWDTPAALRLFILGIVVAGSAALPIAFYRWVWRRRRLDQLARLVARKQPLFGDRLLGVIELVASQAEQKRSPALCAAAIRQVAGEIEQWDTRAALPASRCRIFTRAAAGFVAALVVLAVFTSEAAGNAWVRLIAPWLDTPRYTYAAIAPLPARIVVAHGEPFELAVRLQDGSRWHPARGTAYLGRQLPVSAELSEDRYAFALPPIVDTVWLHLRIGDWRQQVPIVPVLRPELTSVVATVDLPSYLGLPEPLRKDVRGGAITIVKGARVAIAATANRGLREAHVDGEPRAPEHTQVTSLPVEIDGMRSVEFRWRDDFGLSGREPFIVRISGRDDEPPSVSCEGLVQGKVVLDSEVLIFSARARDDFGVRLVGLDWRPLREAQRPPNSAPGAGDDGGGERILAAGGADCGELAITGTFSAKSLGIAPQPVSVRVFVEDYFPGRPRVYSFPVVLYVLDAQQHAIWLTEELGKWQRQSLEVRDREMQLYETNKQLRELAAGDLDDTQARRRIASQAEAERANSRRLSHLAASGGELIRQATRNPEFGVGHLERFAEMLRVLKEISENRMPSVAELLENAARAPNAAAAAAATVESSAGTAPAAASNGSEAQASAASKKGESAQESLSAANGESKSPSFPSISDKEPSLLPASADPAESPPSAGNESPRFSLPQTTLAGAPGSAASCPAQQKLDEAVAAQQELLAEFERINEELDRVLANLEGSTLVKRLKAASRRQYQVGGRIGEQLGSAFGEEPHWHDAAAQQVFAELVALELEGCRSVSTIMDDMEAYFERRSLVRVREVFEEMRKEDIVGGLRQIANDIAVESGVSIALSEFWSDTLDRWAENLVEAGSGGT